MTLTLQTVEAHIRNALGGDSSVEGNGRSIANQAGHYWAGMHDWKCQERIGRLHLRASIDIADATWTESSRTLTLTSAFTNYTWVQGDEFLLTAGADATLGFYRIQSRSSANAIVLETSIGSSADGDTDIDGTITLASVALPTDFRALITQPVSTDSTIGLYLVQPGDVLGLRSGTSVTGGPMYTGSIVWAPSAAALGGAPVPRIEIDPAPTANDLDAFQFTYRADWPDMSDDDDIVPVPSMYAMEMLYLQIVRAVALGYEESDVASMDARLAQIVGGPIFRAAVYADGGVMPTIGRMTGGAAQRYHSSGSGDGWHRTDVVVEVT